MATVVTFINAANRHKFHMHINAAAGADIQSAVKKVREEIGLMDYRTAPLEFWSVAQERKLDASLIDGWWGVEGLHWRYEVICDENKPELICYKNIVKQNGKPGYEEATRIPL